MTYSHKILLVFLSHTAIFSTIVVADDATCKDPDLSKLKAGEKITLCDGSEGVGTLAVCTADAQQGCVTDAAMPAIDTSKLVATEIVAGTTIGGVAGRKLSMKICRNNANLGIFDLHGAPTILPTTSVTFTAGTDTVSFSGAEHGLTADKPIYFTTTGALPGGLTAGTASTNFYYVKNPTATDFQLSTSPGGALFDITAAAGAGTHTVNAVGDGIAEPFDSIDDCNNVGTNSPPYPTSGAEYVCDESNFVNVTGTAADLQVTNAVPTYGNQSFTQIWQDKLTGLYFTNPLHNMAGSSVWGQLIAMCASLNGGTAGNGWRLPHLKELIQLHIDGMSRLSMAAGVMNMYLWASTTPSSDPTGSYGVGVDRSHINYFHRGSVYGAICVR